MLVRQRVFQIACGSADQYDGDTLRNDPLLNLACGRLPASGADLASQPTLSRPENAVDYTIGLVPNPALERQAAPLLIQARAQSAARGGAKVRLAGESSYQAESWPCPRRVVFKAEVLAKGPNTGFVVATRADGPLAV